ncbi:MAG TPA: DUF927 domain-containing protein [Candidatus Obscuribacterales bacterium]
MGKLNREIVEETPYVTDDAFADEAVTADNKFGKAARRESRKTRKSAIHLSTDGNGQAESQPAIQDEALEKPVTDPWLGTKIPAGWTISKKCGVWTDPPEESRARPEEIGGPIWISGFTRDAVGEGWGAVTEWLDRDGVRHQRAIPWSRFHEDGNTLAQELAQGGLKIVPGCEKKLKTYLGSFQSDRRMQSVDKLGWLDRTDGELAFVLPHDVISKAPTAEVVYQPERYSPTESTIKAHGTLEEWQREVAAECAEQPYLVFALCVGLAGPLLKCAGLDSGGFHVDGLSTRGKTTMAQVCASIWGCGADPSDAPDLAFVRRWNSTPNGLEGVCAAHNDLVLVLDELGTCAARDFGKAVYDIFGGQGKNAMDASRNLKKQRTWRMLVLSTGEMSVRQKIEQEHPAKAGQLLRFIDIPIDAGIIRGIAPALVADRIKRACGMYYGSAGPAFVRALLKEANGTNDLKATVTELHNTCAKSLTPESPSPEQTRALKRFALVQAAGILAARLHLLPLTESQVCQSVETITNAWLHEAHLLPDVERGLQSVKDFILRHRESRFKHDTGGPDVVRELAGYWLKPKDLYLFTDEGFALRSPFVCLAAESAGFGPAQRYSATVSSG